MKRLFLAVLIAAGASLLWMGTALAQETGQITVAKLFIWASETPPDWSRGALFSALGLVGALVTIFGVVGGAVPGTAGQAEIDAGSARLLRLSERLEQLISASPVDSPAVQAIEKTVNNLRDDLRTERWRQFGIAAVLYVILGAFFAALLAQDILQALVMGAGWTAFLGTLGLKKDYSVRKTRKDDALDAGIEQYRQALERVRELEQSLRTATGREPVAPAFEITGLMEQYRQARAL